ncbi:beta-ketoacyl synthase N-terminal-like domain-containing protein [Anaerocolumna sp. AGMB13025]|uniref:beta-ketoacyl synthase N-terminal-like domain-containing protein n=1 Tax=Anaerocolumna sp. AGMB13025 TaxID=3039116 RepID=UPI00241D723E|nr:beta-ketoacyl synthase N-terminal-like domain-containing protein [Anaerocolumna sp. AGMB13025]WFR57113.1 beta-ketoacyl synthase N-terminal-like domain-containing protein [Anaerocolumna sp. AGMB13025]
MDVRIPGSNSIDEFWNNLLEGKEGIHDLSDMELLSAGVDHNLLNDENYVKRSSECDDYNCFDAAFFGYSEKEANIIDPQQRLFLESCWRALENAGYIPNKMKGRTGVFGSAGFNKYLLNAVQDIPELLEDENYYSTFIGNEKDYISSRVSYKLGLIGPSVTVQTACSSSLVGIHLACQSLLLYESDCCIAGGANVGGPLKVGYKYQDGFIRSIDGKCRSFDCESSGTIFGSGVGTVVLKRLDDAILDNDRIYAVIRATSVNNDGSRKIGFTAPSREGQQDVMTEAMGLEEIESETIAYVEAHGTGTTLGDPIELSSIMNAIGLTNSEDNEKYPCAIGSVKSNIGHLDVAAGVIGFIKACLCVYQKTIVPTVHFKKLNNKVSFENTRFYIADKVEKIIREFPIRAMVNSLGIGGTNVCAFLEEYDDGQDVICKEHQAYIIKVSAKSQYSLNHMYKDILSHLPKENIGRYCYTLNTKRDDYEFRKILILERNSNGIFELVNTNEQLYVPQNMAYQNYWQSLYCELLPFKTALDFCTDRLGKLENLHENRQQLVIDIAWKIAIESLLVDRRDTTCQSAKFEKMTDDDDIESLWDKLEEHFWIKRNYTQYSVIQFLREVGELWESGLELDWSKMYEESEKHTVSAPTYYFEKKKHWYTNLIANSLYTWNEQLNSISDSLLKSDNHGNNDILIIGKEKQVEHIKKLLEKGCVPYHSIECLLDSYDNQNIQELFTQRYVDRDIHIILTNGLETCENAESYFYSILSDCINIRKSYQHNIHITLLEGLFNGTQNIIAAGLVYGLVTSLPMEMKKIELKQIMFCEEADLLNVEKWIKVLFDINSYRRLLVQKGDIFVTHYIQSNQEKKKISLCDGGNYVITGGTGNVGLLFAEEIYKRVTANIYLISTTYSEEKLEEQQDEKATIIYQRIKRIKEKSISVHVLSYDLSDENELYKLEQYFIEKEIKIDGIIHAAGKVGKARNYAKNIELETIKEYTSVKLKVAEKILELNQKFAFSFCIFISSTVSVLGGLGDSIYSGCNAALNYLLQYRESTKNNIVAVAFDYLPRVFKDEYFDADESKYRGLYANTLTVDEFSSIFDQIINSDSKLLIISKSDINQRIRTFQSHSEIRKTNNSEIKWTREAIKREVETIWSETLGVFCNEEINFFDAGGDSLLAVSLISRLNKAFDNNFTIKYVFKYSTIALMVDNIEEKILQIDVKKKKRIAMDSKQEGIAVIGMAGLFPRADSIDELWDLIMKKECAISQFDSTHSQYYKYVQEKNGLKEIKVRGIINNVDRFDYEFFHISKYEAERMDPQQRKFMEVAWTALEDAGCVNDVDDVKIGVFASQGVSTYYINNLLDKDCAKNDYTYSILMNNSPDALATRVSYVLNLTGVSRTVQSFCSSSLNALDDAILSLKSGGCDVCLVGGVNIEVPQEKGYVYTEGSIFSATGKIYPFDERADGTIFSNGVGAVVIASSEWAKNRGCHIYANVIASNCNNDGRQKVSYLSTSVKGQVDCISGAYEKGCIDPERVVYVETHGTATKIGDPIEILSLTEAFEKYTDKKQFCAVGSIKGNLGHLDRASGITSFIKGCLIAEKRCIPPQAMYESVNANINFEETPFYINKEPIMLKEEKDMVIGVTSLGVGGANIHVILENNKIEYNHDNNINGAGYILNFSAKNQNSLLAILESFLVFIQDRECKVSDIESTLMFFRKEFPVRKSFCIQTKEDLEKEIKNYLQSTIEKEKNDKINTILWDSRMRNQSVNDCVNKMKYVCNQFQDVYDKVIGEENLDEVSIYLTRHYIRECIKAIVDEPVIILFEDPSVVSIDKRTVILSTVELMREGKGMNTNIECDQFINQLLSVLWESGIKINWNLYKELSEKRNIHLPGYVFQKSICWLE